MKWVLLLFPFYKPYKTKHIVVKKFTQGGVLACGELRVKPTDDSRVHGYNTYPLVPLLKLFLCFVILLGSNF